MSKRRIVAAFITGVLAATLCTMIELPYYVTMPGMAQNLSPLVKVENGDKDEGTFMLTTVRMGKANIITYGFAKVRKYYELHPTEAVRHTGETDEEYTLRQLHMMEGSKQAAIAVAYKKAGKRYYFKNEGVYVLNVVSNMPASKYLQAGDRITAVDGRKIESADQLIDYINRKKKGDEITVTFQRKKETKSATLKLQPLPDNTNRIGIGISLTTDRKIFTEPAVKIDSEEIGGPSAGLMFSLEIYNQLVEEDITKGYKIAGTGTVNETGEVGPIGGISQKIIAADQAGADIFFAPNEKGAKNSNYRDALKTAKDIGTKMKIVPIDTFDDALSYLKSLD